MFDEENKKNSLIIKNEQLIFNETFDIRGWIFYYHYTTKFDINRYMKSKWRIVIRQYVEKLITTIQVEGEIY